MEATIALSAVETITTTVDAKSETTLAIVELSAHQLSLVGGGTANVAFL